MDEVERFSRLFDGYDRAFGSFQITRENENGKMVGRALTHTGVPSREQWEAHLEGTGPGLGRIMLRADNTVTWGVIDIDVYTLDLERLEAEVKARGYPLVPIRSKSGGCHLTLFLSEPVTAAKVQAHLTTIAARLGYGGSEIFPKQTSRAMEKDGTTKDLGNWINLPYHDANNTLRYAIREGQPLALPDFLDFAEESRVTEAEFDALARKPAGAAKGTGSGDFADGPPCLEHLADEGGFPSGTRNEGLYNVGVYLKKKAPDDWEDALLAFNQKMCNPPLGLREIQDLIKSLKRKDYHYRCKQAPIAAHCMRRTCLQRDHGVGAQVEQGGGDFLIGAVTKYLSDPVLWGLEIDGRRIIVDTTTLLTHASFAKKCAETLNRVPVPVPGARWAKYIDECLRNCEEVPVPEDASEFGQFRLFLYSWLNGRTQARSLDEVLLEKPWREGGRIYFISSALRKRLDADRFPYRSMHHVWGMLRELGGETEGRHLRTGFRNLWSVPDMAPASVEQGTERKSDAETF